MSGAFIWGKLPAHGDFVARGLAAAEREALDDWLAASLAEAREALGAEFEERYDAAAPWRFARDEVGGWTAGALAPSVDAVGRRYPIMVGCRSVADDGVEAAAAEAEALIYAALAQDWSADRLAEAAGAMQPGETTPSTGESSWWTVAADGTVAARVPGAYPEQLMRSALTVGEGDPWLAG